MAAYAEQVVVCTGRGDWAARIEEEEGGDNLAADLKELLGRGGMFADVREWRVVLLALFPSSSPYFFFCAKKRAFMSGEGVCAD